MQNRLVASCGQWLGIWRPGCRTHWWLVWLQGLSTLSIRPPRGISWPLNLVLGCTQSVPGFYRATGADLPKWGVLPKQSSKPSIGPCHFLSIKFPELKLLGLWWFMACITSHQAPPVRADCLRQDFHAISTLHLQPLLPSCYAKTAMRIQVSGWQALVSHWFVGVQNGVDRPGDYHQVGCTSYVHSMPSWRTAKSWS